MELPLKLIRLSSNNAKELNNIVELVTEFLEILGKQSKIMDELSNLTSGGDKLVDKNIIKSEGSTFNTVKESAKLTSTEKNRSKEASSIFIAKFFEEQKKQSKDTAQKTLTSKLAKPVKKAAAGASAGAVSGAGGGWLSKLLGLLGLGGLTKFLKPGFFKALFKKALEKAKGIVKKILSSAWKLIKGISGKLLNMVKRIFGGLKNALGKVWGKAKGLIGKAWGKIKGIFGKLKNKVVGIFKSVGRAISGLWGKITNSKAYKAFGGIVKNAKNSIGKFFSSIKSKIASVVKSVAKGITSITPGGVKAAAGGVAKSAASKVGGFFSKAGGFIKSTASKGVNAVGRGASAVGRGAKSAAKAVGGMTIGAAKGIVSKATSGVIKGSGGMFKLMGRLTAKGAAKVPIIGPAIEGVLATMDINAMKKKGMSTSELQQKAGKRVITGVSGMVGATGGALLAGTLGSIIPVAGTALGAIVGAIGGDLAGRFLGGLIADHIIPKKYTKTIGAFVTGTPPPKAEMQDFIVKDGEVHKFSRKDEIMGLKSGGAINEFLRGGGNRNVGMTQLLKINYMANRYLKIIAQNTANMSKGGGDNTVVVSNSSSPQPAPKTPSIKIPNNRQSYGDSAYAL
tara:strand:- start:35340 stop:37208 length:1869 start_codon:yes stop_codon:yes gene_type:complete